MFDMTLQGIVIFAMIALLCEAVWESVKLIVPADDIPDYVDRFGVMVIAIFMCWGTGADIFATVDIMLPFGTGPVLTGILCSRGANFIHDKFTDKNDIFVSGL